MRVVIVTFEDPGRAKAFSQALREVHGVPEAAPDTRIGAQGEPHDGHRLVVAWVPEPLEEDIRDSASRCGGVLHEPPARIPPPGDPPDPRPGRPPPRSTRFAPH